VAALQRSVSTRRHRLCAGQRCMLLQERAATTICVRVAASVAASIGAATATIGTSDVGQRLLCLHRGSERSGEEKGRAAGYLYPL
jgi:hypothetical protein